MEKDGQWTLYCWRARKAKVETAKALIRFKLSFNYDTTTDSIEFVAISQFIEGLKAYLESDKGVKVKFEKVKRFKD